MLTITFRQAAVLLLSGTIVLAAGDARSAALNVNLVLSDSSSPYRQFAESFNKALGTSKAGVAVVESQGVVDTRADLIVAVGMKAAGLAAAQPGTPVLAVMIPDAGYQEVLAQTPAETRARAISAIYMNQPLDRKLDFLRAALPDRRRIGFLYSSDTYIDIDDLRQQIEKRGGSLVEQQVGSAEKLFSGLESILDGSDLLLAIPDGVIYNSSNIRNILLASYRKGIPLIGLSQSYVSAGALCAVFSTMEQMAEQASTTVVLYAKNRRLPAPQYPVDFTIAVNNQVARSLGIELPPLEQIRSQIGKNQLNKLGTREK